jgi:hypothetical protein
VTGTLFKEDHPKSKTLEKYIRNINRHDDLVAQGKSEFPSEAEGQSVIPEYETCSRELICTQCMSDHHTGDFSYETLALKLNVKEIERCHLVGYSAVQSVHGATFCSKVSSQSSDTPSHLQEPSFLGKI